MVFLPPGTFGCQLFARAQRQAGNRAQVAYAETGTLPYLARKHGQRVVISGYATRLPTGVFPFGWPMPRGGWPRPIPAWSRRATACPARS